MRLPASIAMLVTPCLLAAQQAAPPVPQVITSATADVELRPDRATIMFTVESRGPTAAAAGAETARRQRAVLDTLRALGIATEQMTTASIQINPEYVTTDKTVPPRVGGYVARNSVRIEVLKIDQAGALLDAALAKEATGVSSLQFRSSRADEARRQALSLAVEKARADAAAMSAAAGGALGPLLELTSYPAAEEMPRVDFGVRGAAASATYQTPVEPGELHVRATVNARWAFSPRG